MSTPETAILRLPGRRADAVVFALSLIAVAFFHQGGGWDQNARFAMVRSIVEEGNLSIDSHLVYYREEDGDRKDHLLQRLPVERGNYGRVADKYAIAWRGPSGDLVAVDAGAASDNRLVSVEVAAATGDVGYADGRFHPGSAPGTALFAVPGYALVHATASLFGLETDSWRVVTINAWLTSVLSVAIATALGAVLVLRLVRRLASEHAARATALTFVLGTAVWPLGTMLTEHNPIAVALLGSLLCIECVSAAPSKPGNPASPSWTGPHAAGFLAGLAALMNLAMITLIPVFAVFLMARTRTFTNLLWFVVGAMWPLAALGAYNHACFGTFWTSNQAWQGPPLVAEGLTLGLLTLPGLEVMAGRLGSLVAGLFFTSPVLVVAVAALVPLWRRPDTRPLAALTIVVTPLMLLLHAVGGGPLGHSILGASPIAPLVGLLALPLAVAFDRWRSLTFVLAAVSVAMQLLLVAVDPQGPIGDDKVARPLLSSTSTIRSIPRYLVPLFVHEQAWPMLEESIETAVAREEQSALRRGESEELAKTRAANQRRDLTMLVSRRDVSPFPLAAVKGPVSANPTGITEGHAFTLSPAQGPHARGNSFNVGEWMFPDSRLSLVPLLVMVGMLAALLLAPARRSASVAR